MQRIVRCLLFTIIATCLSLADNATFQRVQLPDTKGHLTKAVLTFNDEHKAIEVQPVKGNSVSVPYSQIDKCSYEYTQRHRVNEATVATAPIGVGLVMMLTRSKSHWLEIDYHNDEQPHAFVLRMDKHNYIRILDALKAHAGIDAEILGNAKKR